MAEFRTSTGLISCDVFMRTAGGLVQIDPQFRTSGGLIDCGTTTGGGASFTAEASPDYVYGSVSRKATGPVSTNGTMVSVTGGVAPYTYEWSTVGGWTVNGPTSSSASFTSTVAPGQSKTEGFTCTVTDSKGFTTAAAITAQLDNYYSGGMLSDA